MWVVPGQEERSLRNFLAHRSHEHRGTGQDKILISNIGFRGDLTLFKFWLCYKRLCDLGYLKSVSVLYRKQDNKNLLLREGPCIQAKNSYGVPTRSRTLFQVLGLQHELNRHTFALENTGIPYSGYHTELHNSRVIGLWKSPLHMELSYEEVSF